MKYAYKIWPEICRNQVGDLGLDVSIILRLMLNEAGC
jgi:hypothetical protein